MSNEVLGLKFWLDGNFFNSEMKLRFLNMFDSLRIVLLRVNYGLNIFFFYGKFLVFDIGVIYYNFE